MQSVLVGAPGPVLYVCTTVGTEEIYLKGGLGMYTKQGDIKKYTYVLSLSTPEFRLSKKVHTAMCIGEPLLGSPTQKSYDMSILELSISPSAPPDVA